MAGQERRTIDLEEGWAFMQKGITKLKNILEGKPEPQFSSEDYMMLYTYVSLSLPPSPAPPPRRRRRRRRRLCRGGSRVSPSRSASIRF
jgi:hypothetical protein